MALLDWTQIFQSCSASMFSCRDILLNPGWFLELFSWYVFQRIKSRALNVLGISPTNRVIWLLPFLIECLSHLISLSIQTLYYIIVQGMAAFGSRSLDYFFLTGGNCVFGGPLRKLGYNEVQAWAVSLNYVKLGDLSQKPWNYFGCRILKRL